MTCRTSWITVLDYGRLSIIVNYRVFAGVDARLTGGASRVPQVAEDPGEYTVVID